MRRKRIVRIVRLGVLLGGAALQGGCGLFNPLGDCNFGRMFGCSGTPTTDSDLADRGVSDTAEPDESESAIPEICREAQ